MPGHSKPTSRAIIDEFFKQNKDNFGNKVSATKMANSACCDTLTYYDFEGIVIPAFYVHNDKYLKSLVSRFDLVHAGRYRAGLPIMKIDLSHNDFLDGVKKYLEDNYSDYITHEDLT